MRKLLLTLFIFAATLPMTAQSLFELCDRWGMETPVIMTQFQEKYLERNLSFVMTSGIERTPGGRIWYMANGGEDGDKAYIFLFYSDDNGETWSDVKYVIDMHNASLPFERRNLIGNLWTDPMGRLWMFFDQAVSFWDGRGGNWCSICENPDEESPVWSEPKYIGFGASLNKPTVMSTGEWVLPVSLLSPICFNMDKPEGYKAKDTEHPLKNAYPELADKWGAYSFVSTDLGKTWEKRGFVQFPYDHFDEHMFVELSDGRWWMTARTKRGIYQSFSSDKGKTWSAPQYYLPHVTSRHFMRRLASGAILLIRHGYVYEDTGNRRELRAFLSYDEGKTWKGGLLLDERSKIAYPTGFQDKNGDIFISYDYERERSGELYIAKFTEKDVLNCSVSNKGFLKKRVFKCGKSLAVMTNMTLASAVNPYVEEIPDIKSIKKYVIKARKQSDKKVKVPTGAIADASAPGGYYWPLLCGIDIAGTDVKVDVTKCWNDYCDPKSVMAVKPKKNETAAVDPCPEGWALPTEYQLKRICRHGVYSIEVEENTNRLYWNMIDGERSEGDIFGAEYKDVVKVLAGESRAESKGTVWRFIINRGTVPSFETDSQDRTKKFGYGRDRSILRCVRNTGNQK